MTSSSVWLEIFSPLAPSSAVILAALEDERVAPLFTPEVVNGLLHKWGLAYSGNAEAKADKFALVAALMDHGADPWSMPELVESWIKIGAHDLIKHSFAAADSRGVVPALNPQWLRCAVQKCYHNIASLLLERGCAQLPRQEDGFLPLHQALHADMVELLCKHGANPDTSARLGLLPVEEWGGAWRNLSSSLPPRIMGLVRSNLDRPEGIATAGFELAPTLLAACGAAKEAVACAGLTRSGFEVVSAPEFDNGVSPLTGWSWSVFRGKPVRPSSSASRKLLDGCFAARDGIWDVEWVYAAVAVDMMKRLRAGNLESMAAPVRQRMKELESLPALDRTSGNRWQAAVAAVAATKLQYAARDTIKSMANTALAHIFEAMARGDTMIVPIGSVEDMNVLAMKMVSEGATLRDAIRKEWECGIPSAFWTLQNNVAPKWLSKVEQQHVIGYARKCMKNGTRAPLGLQSTRDWSDDVTTWMEGESLSILTSPHFAPGRPRRM